MILEDYIPNLNRDFYCSRCSLLYPYNKLKNENIKECNCCDDKYKEFNKLYILYGCDICMTEARTFVKENNTYIEKINFDSMYKTEKGDACNECFHNKSLSEMTDINELKKRYDTIHYNIQYEKKFEDENVNVYVIYEYNNNTYNQHCEYFLLCLRDNKIILNYKIESYNPYFDIKITDCKVNENTIEIMYREKHSICKVILEFDNDNKDTEYVKYGLYNHNTVGKVLEFKKDDKTIELKSYFR